MQIKREKHQKMRFYQKVWFMWVFLIFLPPLGIFLMWRYRKLSKAKKIVGTVIATVYLATAVVMGVISTPSLFLNQDEFVRVFHGELEELKLPYTLKSQKQDQHTITSKLDDDITLIENIDAKGRVCELVMVGQGEGNDIVLAMGLLIGTVDQTLSNIEIGQVLKELRLFDTSYSFHKNETTVERNNIRYNLKYDQNAGVIFSISPVSN